MICSMKEFIANSPEETQKIAQDFSGEIFRHQKKSKKAIILALEGDLGSGKTTFTQGLAKGLGIKESITSPTFVLIKKYKIEAAGDLPDSAGNWQAGSLRPGANFRSLFHIDCYRVDKPWQMQELGWDEIINNPENIIVIEWPEKISEILLEDKIVIKFEFIGENKREIIFD